MGAMGQPLGSCLTDDEACFMAASGFFYFEGCSNMSKNVGGAIS